MAILGTVGDRFDMLYTGEENCDRLLLSSATFAPASGVMRLSYFTARKTEPVTQISVYTGSTAAAATPTLCAFGVYSEDPITRNLTLVAQTTNDTTLFAAASTKYTKAFTAGFTKSAGTRYAFASLVVTGVAPPSFASIVPQAAAELDLAPRRTGQITGQASIPSSITAGSIVASGGFIYSVIS